MNKTAPLNAGIAEHLCMQVHALLASRVVPTGSSNTFGKEERGANVEVKPKNTHRHFVMVHRFYKGIFSALSRARSCPRNTH